MKIFILDFLFFNELKLYLLICGRRPSARGSVLGLNQPLCSLCCLPLEAPSAPDSPVSGSQGNTRRTQLLLLCTKGGSGKSPSAWALLGQFTLFKSNPQWLPVLVPSDLNRQRYSGHHASVLSHGVLFSLPDPDSCCHILSSVCLFPALHVYSSREPCHLSLSVAVSPAFVAGSHFPSLSDCCAHPSSLTAVLYGHPSGGLFHLSLTLPGASWISA